MKGVFLLTRSEYSLALLAHMDMAMENMIVLKIKIYRIIWVLGYKACGEYGVEERRNVPPLLRVVNNVHKNVLHFYRVAILG